MGLAKSVSFPDNPSSFLMPSAEGVSQSPPHSFSGAKFVRSLGSLSLTDSGGAFVQLVSVGRCSDRGEEALI